MAKTSFSGPVASANGFEGDIVGGVVAATTLVIGTTTITAGSVSGTVSVQAGRIPVLIGSTTLYIGLYASLVP